MRSIVIMVSEGKILERLSKIPGWNLERLGIPNAHEYCLAQREVKIALRFPAENVACTSNILPYDASDHNRANDFLSKLHEALIASKIECYITAPANNMII